MSSEIYGLFHQPAKAFRGNALHAMNHVKVARILSGNIQAILAARHQTQHDLALWCRHSDVWLSNFLAGKRQIQLRDLDRLADFFGLATYQLFQPGISAVSERRSGRERRQNRDRRIGIQNRLVQDLADALDFARPPRSATQPSKDSRSADHLPPSDPVRTAIDAEVRRRITGHAARQQAATPRSRVAGSRPRDRKDRR